MEKNKGKIIEKMKDNKGITLLALAVTIVVLLILTSIGIKLALGNNGIIGEAKNAKEQAEIDEEKGIVKRATTVSLIRSKGSKVEQDTLEKALNDETGEGKTEVSDVGDVFEIVFIDSNRYYEVDSEGNISDSNKITKDEYAGDITKGGRCDGSEEKPYEISCIEDLVVLSNITNGTGIKLENGVAVNINKGDTLEGKYIVLTRDLNFKSKYSYDNYSRTDFGNLNNDDTDGNMLMTEMTTGTGFVPIGLFGGSFDGKDRVIDNIYINATVEDKKYKALFRQLASSTTVIKNLTVTGEIKSNSYAAGIVGGTQGGGQLGTISSCINKVDVTGYNAVGGIAGAYIKNINNCKNYGTLEITGNTYQYAGVGGIVGIANNWGDEVEINNCVNYGEIKGVKCLGGIVGTSAGVTVIRNCANKGKINNLDGLTDAGGILSWQKGDTINLINCWNEGDVIGKNSAGGIVGSVTGASWTAILNTYIKECYNIGSVVSENNAGGIVGNQGTTSANNNLYIYNSWNLGKLKGKTTGFILGRISTGTSTVTKTEFENVYCTDTAIGIGTLTNGEATLKSVSEIKSKSFVDLLNSNIGTNTDWKRWKLGEDGYPTFED